MKNKKVIANLLLVVALLVVALVGCSFDHHSMRAFIELDDNISEVKVVHYSGAGKEEYNLTNEQITEMKV